jgi:hypothetical protein
MITPPRVAESLLEALGAAPDYREAVMGDLAEEFEVRAQRDGEGAARSWYVREAAYAVPALLRSAARNVRGRALMHLVGLALTAFVLSRFVIGFVLILALRVLQSADTGTGDFMWVILALKVPLGLVSVVLAGYIAAWLHERAPLVAAMMLGGLWVVTGIAASAILVAAGVFPNQVPVMANPWLQLANAILLIVGTTTGGVLRVISSRLPPRHSLAR